MSDETTSQGTTITNGDTVETIASRLMQQGNMKEIFPKDPYDHINDKISKENFLQNAVLVTAEALFCLGLASSVASFILGENKAPHVGLMIGGFVTIVFSVLIFGIVMCMKCATKLDDKKQNPTVHDFTVKEIQKAYEAFYSNANSSIGKSHIPQTSFYDAFSQALPSTNPSFHSKLPLSNFNSYNSQNQSQMSKYSKETTSRRQRRLKTKRSRNQPRQRSADTYQNFDSTPPTSLTGSINKHRISMKHSLNSSGSDSPPRLPEKVSKKSSLKSEDSGAYSGSRRSSNVIVYKKKKSKRSSSHAR